MTSITTIARWLAAALIVVSAHAAAVAVMFREPEIPLEEEASGAFLVELAPMVASAPAPPLELPPGPLSVESVETPQPNASAQAELPPPESDLPPLPELPSEPSEVALPKQLEQPPEEHKAEDSAEQQKKAATPQAASVASQAAAPTAIEDAARADRPAAPAVGVSARDRRMRAQWHGALSAHLVRHARFPAAVREHARDRQVLVRFRIDRRGHVISTAVAEGSGSDLLDGEAEAMIRRASPMPLPPEQVIQDALDLIVPVRFKARR